jgi:hypothetical protein
MALLILPFRGRIEVGVGVTWRPCMFDLIQNVKVVTVVADRCAAIASAVQPGTVDRLRPGVTHRREAEVTVPDSLEARTVVRDKSRMLQGRDKEVRS